MIKITYTIDDKEEEHIEFKTRKEFKSWISNKSNIEILHEEEDN